MGNPNKLFPDYAWVGESQLTYITAVCIGFVSATFSVVGCTVVLVCIWKQKSYQQSMYHRLVLGLAIADLVSTISIVTAPFLIPRATGLYFAQGTIATCEASGFFLLFTSMSYMFNAELSLYFLLMIRYNWSRSRMRKVLEPTVYILPVLLPLLTGIGSLQLDAINVDSILGLCDIGPYPPRCHQNPTVDCERGEQFVITMWPYMGFLAIFVVAGYLATWLVFWTVLQQQRKSRRHAFHPTAVSSSASQTQRHWDLAIQSVLYTAAFFLGSTIVLLPFTANLPPPEGRRTGPMATLLILGFAVHPLAGFLNCCIYLRLRVRSWREADDQQRSLLWAVRQSIVAGYSPASHWSAAHRSTTNPALAPSAGFTQPPTIATTDGAPPDHSSSV